MDTNLKRSKKIKALFYRVMATGALCTMLFTALLGREAFSNLYQEGWGTLSGDIYYLTEFREYIADLYIYGMANFRLGDDEGYSYPYNNENAESLRKEYIETFHNEVTRLGKDILYYIDDTKYNEIHESGNIIYPLFSENDGHLLLPADVKVCCYWNGADNRLRFFFSFTGSSAAQIPDRYCNLPYRPSVKAAENARFVIALQETESYSSRILSGMSETAQSYRVTLITFFVSMGIFLISGLCCLFTGKSARQARPDYAAFVGKIWAEFKLLLLISSFVVCGCHNLFSFNLSLEQRLNYIFYDSNLTTYNFLWMYFIPGALLYLFYVDLRHNGTEILKASLIYKLHRAIRDFITGQAWYRSTAAYCTIAFLSSLALIFSGIGFTLYLPDLYQAGFLLLLLGILLFIVTIRIHSFMRDTRSIADRLAAIQNGKFCQPLQLPRNSLLTQAARDLNAVGDGIENAVEQKNRSNKMRVELITNVSHDLKTPLTSIINYADLLCEERLPEPAAEYAASLQAKAYRLKSMVQDVFELSKATSGNLPVEITRLDLAKLLRQTLADMDEQIQESNLTFKLNISDEPLMIDADGERLYRVFQNLFINALQYSLDNSRVHIQLTRKDGFAYAKVKNISRDEMDFAPCEIIERFVRADTSRTTEGSGLGLSIAQSFTESCGGTFTIDLDADLFTACVAFPLAKEVTPASEEVLLTDNSSTPAETDSELIVETKETKHE